MSTIKISQLGNLTTVYGNVIVPVVGNIAGTLTSLQSNVAQLQTYILGTVVTDLANLTVTTTANAAIQLSQIGGANAAIVTANTAMKGYADAITTAWTSNATTQLSQITGANAAIVTANTAMKDYVDGANTIQSAEITAISNSVIGANAAIVTANTAMKGYADAITTAWTSNATTQLSQITGANAAIVTANTAMKGYADGQITIVSNSITGANAAIVTANTAMKDYVDANNASQLTSINNITNGTATFGNITPTANITYNLGNLTYWWNTVHTNTISTSSINLPLSGSLLGATVNGIDYAILSGPVSGAAALVTSSANVANTNYISINPTYANMVIHNADTATTHTWQFTSNGNLTLPTHGTVSYTPTTSSDWAGTAPTTIQAAIDRLAAVVKSLNSGTGA